MLFFFLHCIFLNQGTPAPLTIPEGTGVKLDSTKDPLGCSNFLKVRFFFSPDILEVLLKLTGFLGFGERRKETT